MWSFRDKKKNRQLRLANPSLSWRAKDNAGSVCITLKNNGTEGKVLKALASTRRLHRKEDRRKEKFLLEHKSFYSRTEVLVDSHSLTIRIAQWRIQEKNNEGGTELEKLIYRHRVWSQFLIVVLFYYKRGYVSYPK